MNELSIEGAFPSKIIPLKILQSSKISSPMLVTLSGITTLVKLAQDPNAYLPMLITLLPIVTLFRFKQ